MAPTPQRTSLPTATALGDELRARLLKRKVPPGTATKAGRALCQLLQYWRGAVVALEEVRREVEEGRLILSVFGHGPITVAALRKGLGLKAIKAKRFRQTRCPSCGHHFKPKFARPKQRLSASKFDEIKAFFWRAEWQQKSIPAVPLLAVKFGVERKDIEAVMAVLPPYITCLVGGGIE